MIIKNGIVADPASGLYEQMDILVKDGKIVKIAPDISCASDAAATEKEEIIDASGMIVGPGLIDTHVHFVIRASHTRRISTPVPWLPRRVASQLLYAWQTQSLQWTMWIL